jgi:hypothetical protein
MSLEGHMKTWQRKSERNEEEDWWRNEGLNG